MATKTTKLAGPDRNGNYKVLQVKGHLQVKPGELYTERHVTHTLVRSSNIEVTVIEPKWTQGERKEFHGATVN